MNAREPLDDAQLLNILEEQSTSARDFYNNEIADEQESAIKFYECERFGDEVEGQSQIVLPDVRDAVDHMTIQVIKPFVSGDRVIEFEAKSEDDAQFADEATEAVSKQFMRGQDGFRVIHDWVKAGLKEKFCALKSTATIERKVITQRYQVDADQLAMIDPETAATAQEQMTPQGPVYIVTERKEISVPKFVDYTLPSEEYRFSHRARSEDDADFQEHICRKTRSDLVEMGFDVEQVYDLPTDSESLITDGRANARDKNYTFDTPSNASMQEVVLHESYIRIDVDGDGIAELLQVFRVGSEILRRADGSLAVTPLNEQPFTVFTPFPEPHRLIGKGLADKAMLHQRVRSVIARQLMNGMYRHNEPRFWVPNESMTENTLDDLLETVGPVRGKGSIPPTLLGGQFDVSKSLGVLEFFSREREVSTGITDINQGLAPDVLNTTATAAKIQDDRSAQTAEFISRVFGEAFARACAKKYRLLKEIGEPFDLKIDGEYRRVDPSLWPDDFDVMVRVGLGTGSKDHRLQLRMSLLEMQKEGLQIGMARKEHLFNNAAAIVKDAGLGQADDYFVNPANEPEGEQGEQPDPAMLEMQQKAQLDQAKLQGEQQLAQQRIQLMQAEATEKANLARQQAELDAELARDKANAEMALAERRMAFEQDLATRRMQFEAATRMAREMPQDRPGGSLAA